jgi:hypothetical protein
MDRWLFVHVMKTAGTSFRTMLEQGLAAAIYPTQDELRRHPRHFYLTAPELLDGIAGGAVDLAGRRVVCGHYAAALADDLPGSWRVATFLRDPVKRSLSMIAHRHKRATRLARFVKPDVSAWLDREDFVERQIRDYQTKAFALDGRGEVNRPHAIDAEGFARAKARLLAADFVGLTERLSESARLFEGMSGLRLGPPPHRNKSPAYAASAAEIARIRALVPHDIELYELARAKLDQALAAAA